MNNYSKLLNNFELLKLDKIREFYPNYIDNVSKKNISLTDMLYELTNKEIEYRNDRASQIQITVSAFPYKKEISDFDFDYQPSINKQEILELNTLGFLDRHENILFVGPSGVGKTHLATSIGITAAKKRYSVYFISCHDLITQLNKAHYENKLDARIKHFCRYELLIIDEIGYLPVDKQGANLFFQLIAKRYEKHSTIITTNQTFNRWGEVFSDNILANAILDRLLHHSTIINIKGNSYRIKDKLDHLNENEYEN
jgi:DNA replication protein DnaC